MNITVIAATTSAVSTHQFRETAAYPEVVIAASGLAGAEEVDIFVNVAGSWVAVPDGAGGNVTLTATIPMRTFIGGPTYGITKDATAGAAAVDIIPVQAF